MRSTTFERMAATAALIILVGCSTSAPRPAKGQVLLRTATGWIELAGATVGLNSPARIVLRQAGQVSSSVSFDSSDGTCDLPQPVDLRPGEEIEFAISCTIQDGGVAEVRVHADEDFAVLVIAVPLATPDAGLDSGTPSVCVMRRIQFGDTFSFAKTDPDSSTSKIFTVFLEGDGTCVVGIEFTQNGDGVFQLMPSTQLTVDQTGNGTSQPLGLVTLFQFAIQFNPQIFDAEYVGRLVLRTNGVVQGDLTLFGAATPRCPALDGGCPLVARDLIYLSTSDSLFVWDAGAVQRIGDFRTQYGQPIGAKDIAVLSDGRLLVLGPADLFLADPLTATCRELRAISGNQSALEGLPDGGLLVGGIDGLSELNLETGADRLTIPGFAVSGDIAFLSENEVYFTVSGANSDSLLRANLNPPSAGISYPLPTQSVWALVSLDAGLLLGLTPAGDEILLSTTGGVIQTRSLPGYWTGAARLP